MPTDHHHSSSLVANASQTARKASAESAMSHESKSGYCRSDVVGETMITPWLALAFARRLGLEFWQRRRDSFTIRTTHSRIKTRSALMREETLSLFEKQPVVDKPQAQRLRRAQSLRRLRG